MSAGTSMRRPATAAGDRGRRATPNRMETTMTNLDDPPRWRRGAHAWRRFAVTCATMLAVLGYASPADARLTRLVVDERLPLAGGVEWGTVGAYERLKGTAYMEVDPLDPLNA